MVNLLESINVQTNVPLDSRTVVKTLANRDSINTTVRYLGMKVYVSDEKKEYRLEDGIENSHWKEIKGVTNLSEMVSDNDHMTVSKSEKDKWDSKADGTHNHDEAYSKLDHNHDTAYAAKSHGHQASEITGMPELPESLKNPHALTIQLNGTGDVVYDGSAVKSVNITPAGIGAQPSGDYALATHNHEGVYQPKGEYALSTHNHDSVYQPKGEYALSSHNHDSVYAPTAHTHTEYLSSQGNITVNGNLTVTGEILSNNNVTAYSDIKVKKNIRDIDDSVIEKLKKVRFCNFEYKDCKDDRKRVGVIAQELEELFPELVFEDHNGIKTVDYTGLNIYFSFAMQKKLFG